MTAATGIAAARHVDQRRVMRTGDRSRQLVRAGESCYVPEGVRPLRWYADNSELNGIKSAQIPDILMFGGIVVGEETERHIRSEMAEVKRTFGAPQAPLKWNMKDLRPLYVDLGIVAVYDRLLESSREWRAKLFGCLSSADCALIVACIEGYSSKRSVLKDRREELTRYAFTNGLMRYGLYVQETRPKTADVVLDWPDKGASQPFIREYAHAHTHGRTVSGTVPYKCGKLSTLGFADSVMFTDMPSCAMLQIADLVVGATREFLECCLKKKSAGQGLDCLRLVRGKFRGAPSNIIGRGLVVSTGNTQFRTMVETGIKELLYAA